MELWQLGNWMRLHITEVSTNVSTVLPASELPTILAESALALYPLECILHSTILLALVNHTAKCLQELCCFEIFCTKRNVLTSSARVSKEWSF